MPNYPGSLDDDISLFLAVNNARTKLTSSITISDLTIPVVTTSGFPNQGFVTILSNPEDITEAEAIAYTGVTETSFSGTLRGAGNTPIFAHAVGNNVDLTVMAEHHNELKDAVIALEQVVGISGSENFVPKDAQGNVIISGTLGIGDPTGTVISGSTLTTQIVVADTVCADTLVKVGTATVASGIGVITAFQDTQQTTTSSSFVDVNCETSTLENGVEYVILYCGNYGGSTGVSRPELKLTLGALAVAKCRDDQNTTVTSSVIHNRGGRCQGVYVATGNGVDTLKFQLRAAVGTDTVAAGAMGIIAIPTAEFTENTNYFKEVQNGDACVACNVFSTYTNVLESTFNITDPGDYIYLGSVEANDDRGNTAVENIRFLVDAGQVSPEWQQRGRNVAEGFDGYMHMEVVNLSSGNHTFSSQIKITTGSFADGRRGRNVLLKKDLFDQFVETNDTTGANATSGTFADFAGLDTTYVPNQTEDVVIIAFTTIANDAIDEPGGAQLRNDTAGQNYRIDSGHMRSSVGTGENHHPLLMMHLERDLFISTDYKVQYRNTATTVTDIIHIGKDDAQTGGMENGGSSLFMWSMALSVSGTIPQTQVLITGDSVFANTIDAVSSLTVSGIPVHAGDPFSVQNIIVSGDACLNDTDVKGNLTVSGTAKFGQPEPVAAFGSVIFASQDIEQTATSASLVDANCETTPLLDGVEYLVIYNGYAGNDFTTQKTQLRIDFGATKIGGGNAQKSNLGTFGNNHFNGISTNGIFKVTGDGTSTVKFRFLGSGAGGPIYAGAMSITCIPLDQFVEGTDYYYAQNANNNTFDVINAPNADLPATSLLSSTFTGMAAGDWLFIWSDEVSVGNATGRAFATRFQVDSTTVGPSRYGHHNDNTSGSIFTFASAHVVNVPSGGNIPVEILVSSNVAAESDWRRGRIFAINTSSFNQVLSTTNSTGLTVNSGAYLDFNGINTTINPSQPDAPVIILTSATSYTQDINSGVAAAIRNETDGVDYRDDSGKRSSVLGGLGAAGIDLDNLFMVHFEERTASTEYRAQIRSEGAGNVSIGRNDDDDGGELSEMIVWEFTPTAPFIPITQTCIDDDEIQTGTFIADTINSRLSLTVSGLAVHAGDPLSLSNLIVTDAACLNDVDVKGNLTVSGTAKFGQDNTPPSANGDIVFASQDTEQTTASLTFVDANCETAPLLNGVEYLIIYAGNFGIDSESISVESQTLLGSLRIGRSGFAESALGTGFPDNANNASYCHGIFRATGNGTDTVKFQFRVVSGTQTAYADAMSIICIPLDAYVQNTDYFFVETTNSDSAVVTNAPITDPPTGVMLSNTFTSMDAGDWLFICSAEGNVSAGATRGASMRFQVASTTIGTSRYTFQGRSAGNLTWNSVAVANIVNVAGGNTAVDILVASTGAQFADFFRGRIFAIKRSLFTQILSTTDTTGAATSSSAFVDFTPLDTTIVPTQPNSPIIVLTTAPSYTQQNDSGFTSAIRNETDATDYRADSGGREAERGGISSPDINLANSFMAHFEERSASTEYRYQYRTVGVGPVAVGRNDDDSGGEHSEMIVWEFLNSGAPFVPITQTCIDDDQILTGTLIVDDGTFNTSLTISGVPVSTGTGGGGPGGDFVARAGDSMTGNLEMQGNNVFNAGVVVMQEGTPVLTTSGLLWFDTDATGHGDHGSASLPGGMLAATLTSSSGIAIPDAVFKDDIPWDTVDIDNGGWYDAAFPQRLTVPSGVRYAQVYANINFGIENNNNRRQIRIYRNGDTADNVAEDNQRSIANASFYPTLAAHSAVITVSGGDYFQLSADLNTDGGPLDILASGTNFGILAIDTRGIPGVNSVNLLQGDINVVATSGISVSANSQTGEIEISLAQETRDLQVWSPDAPPASGTSFDSEWNPGPGLTGWTEWDVGGDLTVSTLPVAGVLRLKNTRTTAGVAGLIKTAPTSNFTIFTKLFMMQNTSEDFREFGVVLSDDLLGNPSTANFAVVSVPFHEDGTDAQAYYFGFATQHFTDWDNFDRNLSFSAVHFPANEPIYVKVHVDVTTRIVRASASRDGLIWGQEKVSDFSGDLSAITEMGYWIGNNTSAGPLTITSDFFRVVEGDDDRVPLLGNFLTVSGVPQAIVVATGTQGGGGGGSGDGNITDINAQEGPSVTIIGVGPIDVITVGNVLTITGTDGLGISDINEQFGPSISITGTAGIGVTTLGNVITIDGTEVQGAGGSGATISGCYTHIQSSASDTWNVTHNLSSVPVNYIVLDNSSTEVIPDTFTVNDGDSVTITFAVPQAGTADIFPCVSGTSEVGDTVGTATVSGCYSHVQTLATGTWTIDHNLGTDVVNYVVLDNSGSQIQPDDFTVVDANQVTLGFVSDRTGIANIFACVDGDVIFDGGVFANLVAVTGTFIQGITVGSGTTFISGEGIDTPELKIAGETPSFGGGSSPVQVSGTYFNPLVLPINLHSASDWFDDNSGNPTLTGSHTIDLGKWTLWDVDGVAHANNGRTSEMRGGDGVTRYDMNIMRVVHDGSTIGGWIGYFQDAPSGDFTITAKVSNRRGLFDGSAGGEENSVGIFIAGDLAGSPSTADLVSMTIGWDGFPPSSNGWAVYAGTQWTDYNSQGASSEITTNQVNESLWVRIWYRTSDDRTAFFYSHDGMTWSELKRVTPIGFTVSKIGFGINSNKAFSSTGKIEFFAVADADVSDDPVGHGRMLPLPIFPD